MQSDKMDYEITVFEDETSDAPGLPWVVAEEEKGCVPEILDRFATEGEAMEYATHVKKKMGITPVNMGFNYESR